MSDKDLTLTVEFKQRIKITPPLSVNTQQDARYWFEADPEEILWDAIDVHHGDTEIISIEGQRRP